MKINNFRGELTDFWAKNTTGCRTLLSAVEFAPEFAIDVVLASAPHLPKVEDTYVVQEASYLHALFRSSSLGHILRDNLPSIVANLDDLSLDQHTYQVVIFTDIMPSAMSNIDMFRKYVKLVAPSSVEWSTLVTQATNGYLLLKDVVVGSLLQKYHPIRIMVKVSPPKPPRISGSKAVASFPGRDWNKAALFKRTRDVAFTRLAVGEVVNARDHRPLRVLFGDKGLHDKRRITNIPSLLLGLRNRFPNVEIRSIEMYLMSAHEQLQVLSTTSIFITPVSLYQFLPQTFSTCE